MRNHASMKVKGISLNHYSASCQCDRTLHLSLSKVRDGALNLFPMLVRKADIKIVINYTFCLKMVFIINIFAFNFFSVTLL